MDALGQLGRKVVLRGKEERGREQRQSMEEAKVKET